MCFSDAMISDFEVFFVIFISCHGESFVKFNRFWKNVVCCKDIKDWDMISVVCEDVSLI